MAYRHDMDNEKRRHPVVADEGRHIQDSGKQVSLRPGIPASQRPIDDEYEENKTSKG
jgi:hypothetical protein